MNKLICLTLLIGMAWINLTNAQESGLVVPAPPLVKPVPERAEWLMKKGQGAASEEEVAEEQALPADNPASEKLRSVNIVRTGKVKKMTLRTRGGVSREFWIESGQMYLKEDNQITSGWAVPLSPAKYSGGAQFYGTECVKPEFYQGQVSFRGVPCHLYKGQVASPGRQMLINAGISVVDKLSEGSALISVETRLPVAVSTDEGDFVYSFSAAPEADLNLPTEFRNRQEALAKESKRQQKEASIR